MNPIKKILDSVHEASAEVASRSAQWLDKGFTLEKVSVIDQKIRYGICQACPSGDFRTSNNSCAVCKCPMEFKTSLKYDPFKSLMKKKLITCPKGHW